MYSKVLCLLGLFAMAECSLPEIAKAVSKQYVIKRDLPVVIKSPKIYAYGPEYLDYFSYPKYEFEYKVEDYNTGDFKKQREIREGDVVKGVYELLQPDGNERKVEYFSSDKTGFQADVKYNINHNYPAVKIIKPYPYAVLP